jgi:Cu/Ag efflux pump CusA
MVVVCVEGRARTRWAAIFQIRAKERLRIIMPLVFFVIFLLLYMVFHPVLSANAPLAKSQLCVYFPLHLFLSN